MRLKGVTVRAAAFCWLVGAVALVGLSLTGNPRAGTAVALGLVLGSVNGLLAQLTFNSGLGMRWSSLPRLAVLSAVALGAGFLLGPNYVWLVILGVASAQLVLVAVAARSLVGR